MIGYSAWRQIGRSAENTWGRTRWRVGSQVWSETQDDLWDRVADETGDIWSRVRDRIHDEEGAS